MDQLYHDLSALFYSSLFGHVNQKRAGYTLAHCT